jgi:hypothetical protein
MSNQKHDGLSTKILGQIPAETRTPASVCRARWVNMLCEHSMMEKSMCWPALRLYPTFDNLKAVCVLAWKHLIGQRRQAGVSSGAQLAFKIFRLWHTPDIRVRIQEELNPGQYAAETADEAVERVLEFDRSWASFELPRVLRAFSDIQHHVIGGRGNYSFFAGQMENLFRPHFQVALEEFGVPLQVSDKLTQMLAGVDSMDGALAAVKGLNIQSLNLDPFEQELIKDCQAAL